LLTATALLAALLTTLTSGLLLLLTGLLLATLLAASLTTLLLPALLHITHFVVRHRARLRGRTPRHDNFSASFLVPRRAIALGSNAGTRTNGCR
jgi:hypothetical protein